MSGTAVIGTGNTLRRDDGAGVEAARRIARAFPGAHVITGHGLQPEMAEAISSCDVVVFLDASVRTSAVSVTRVAPPDGPAGHNVHAVTPDGLMAIVEQLYGSAPREALLVEIPAFECGFGERMSERTLRMVDSCVQLVAELLRGETTPEILLCLAPTPAHD
ncbi:MAG TPA: hydrogenase maturation protease [Bacteroidota bacterium]|nr:hydrogenase maturation protease [Bacteroidota bacterium]